MSKFNRQHFCLCRLYRPQRSEFQPVTGDGERRTSRFRREAKPDQLVADDCPVELIISLEQRASRTGSFKKKIRKKRVYALSLPMESCRGWRFCRVILEPRCTLPFACPWPSRPQGNTDQLPFVLVPKQNYSPNLPRAPLRPYPNLELKLLLA